MNTRLHLRRSRRAAAIILAGSIAALLATPLHAATYTVTSLTDSPTAAANDGTLRGAILAANADGGAASIVFNISGGGTITLAANAGGSRMLPILKNTNGISIDGANGGQGGIVIDGASSSNTTGDRIFFAGISTDTANGSLLATNSATWSFSNLTLQNGNAQGGSANNGGGAGAGLGGAVFVNAGSATFSNVDFAGNRAVGGSSTGVSTSTNPGGGGGMGGSVSASGVVTAGGTGGGGFGLDADAFSGASGANPGQFTGGTKAGNGSTWAGPTTYLGGADGGSGGAPANTTHSGGGGGVGGSAGTGVGGSGGNGGFGGGGGSASTNANNGGDGGFGGGGGSASSNISVSGGDGGFGGGGGGSKAGTAGTGGFGGGNAGVGLANYGGGGSGMGGAIFVRQGASISLDADVTFSGDSITGGTGGNGSLTTDNGMAIGQAVFLAGSTTWNVASGTTTISETLGGGTNAQITGGLTKGGDGKLILTGANSYTGGTIISAGTLLANNTTGSGAGAGNVAVNGGTFGGTGAITGSVTVNAGGTIAPGASIETLDIGSLSLTSANSVFALEIDLGLPAADLLNVTGGITLNGSTLDLSLINPSPVGLPEIYLFAANDSTDPVSGTFGSITGLPFGYTATVIFDFVGTDALGRIGTGNDLALLIVPEPATLAGPLAAILGILIVRRRARR